MRLRAFLLAILVTCLASVAVPANRFALTGPHRAGWRTVTVTRPNNTTFTAKLYYPATVYGADQPFDPSGGPYPAVTFGHGFFQLVVTYQTTLEHLASHGILVIASDSESGILPNHQNFANDLRHSLTWLEQENANPNSVLFNRVRTDRFGASGHSMGGGASILAAAQDGRIKALANLAAAETNPSAIAAMPSVTAPVSLISASADTIVPIANHGQLMYNASGRPKLLPVIQGGWHCGFQDGNGFGCDTGTISRLDQLWESRRLLASFFTLYLKNDESAWKEVWGQSLRTSFVTAQSNPGFELVLPAEVSVPVGSNVQFQATVTNRAQTPQSFSIFSEQRRWLVTVSPAVTPVLGPNESAVVNFSVRRLWKNPRFLDTMLISARSNADNLTRASAVVNIR